MANMSLMMAMAKLSHYAKLVKELQLEQSEKAKQQRAIQIQTAARKKQEQAVNQAIALKAKAKQAEAVSKLIKSDQKKFHLKNVTAKNYQDKNIGKSLKGKLEHKKMYKVVEPGVNGGVVVNYGTLEADRHQYLMDILNKANITDMSVESKAAAIEGVPKYSGKGDEHKGKDLSDTAYFKRAETGTKRLARNLEQELGSKKGKEFIDHIGKSQKLSSSKMSELKNIKSKKAFFNFMINQQDYEILGSSFVTAGNKTSRAFRSEHKDFGTNPTSDPTEIAKREFMMMKDAKETPKKLTDEQLIEIGGLSEHYGK